MQDRVLIEVFALFTSNADLVTNLFYLATFPLTALAAFVAAPLLHPTPARAAAEPRRCNSYKRPPLFVKDAELPSLSSGRPA